MSLAAIPSALLGKVRGQRSLSRAETRAYLWPLTPCTWSTRSPAARRFSRKVSLQARCVSGLSLVLLSHCPPSLSSSSQTRTKSARTNKGRGREHGWGGCRPFPDLPASQRGHQDRDEVGSSMWTLSQVLPGPLSDSHQGWEDPRELPRQPCITDEEQGWWGTGDIPEIPPLILSLQGVSQTPKGTWLGNDFFHRTPKAQ
jgi:hypothetical protein